MTSLSRRQWRWLLLVVVTAVALAEAAYRSSLLAPLDALYSDAWHRLAGTRGTPAHVALVVVDQATLVRFGDEPLAFFGPHFATAIERLRALGASVIGLDFLLAISPDAWLAKVEGPLGGRARVYDAGLRQAIAAGDVVLAAGLARDDSGGGDRFALPHPDYLLAVPDLDLTNYVGLAELHADHDGVVRRYVIAPTAKTDTDDAGLALPKLSFAALLAKHHRERNGAAGPAANGQARHIAYRGPPGAMPRLSLAHLLSAAPDDPLLRSFAGKVVIIGADFPGMGDIHFTPYSTGFAGDGRQLMGGAELQANILETLLSGRHLHEPPAWMRIGVSATLAALVALALLVSGSLPIGTAIALLSGSLVIASAYPLFIQGFLVSVAAWHGALLAAFVGGVVLLFTGEARQRARLAGLFGRYLSDAAVKVLLRGDQVPELGGSLSHITVLFSDIRNFTTLSEQLAPAEVVEVLNEYFERVCQPVLAEGGSIDKYIGDAIMVEFGTPLPTSDHALRALRVALRMRAIALEFRTWMTRRFPDRDLPEFAIGIGIHTGDAIVGSIGSRRRSEFTAIGDTVNIASRLEGMTKVFHADIVASEATVSAAGREHLRLGRSDVVSVKGHRQPVSIYEILDVTMETDHGQ